MGINLKQYKLPSSEDIKEIADLEEQLKQAESNCLNLRKESHLISIILNNEIEYETNMESLRYRMIHGRYPGEMELNSYQVIGHISTEEVKVMYKEIVDLKLEDFDDFQSLYNSLKSEVRNGITGNGLLEEQGGMSLQDLHTHYISKLVEFYKEANLNNNSVIVCIE